jgi:hypothetical protein
MQKNKFENFYTNDYSLHVNLLIIKEEGKRFWQYSGKGGNGKPNMEETHWNLKSVDDGFFQISRRLSG